MPHAGVCSLDLDPELVNPASAGSRSSLSRETIRRRMAAAGAAILTEMLGVKIVPTCTLRSHGCSRT